MMKLKIYTSKQIQKLIKHNSSAITFPIFTTLGIIRLTPDNHKFRNLGSYQLVYKHGGVGTFTRNSLAYIISDTRPELRREDFKFYLVVKT